MKVLLVAVPPPYIPLTDIERTYWFKYYAVKTNIYKPLGRKWFHNLDTLQRQNIGLLSIASVLRNEGHEVAYVAPGETESLKDTVSNIEDYDLCGLSCWTANMHHALRYAAEVKATNNNIRTVIGGPHVTFMPTETLNESLDIDYIVMGEGEATIRELVAALDSGGALDDIKGMAFRHEGIPHITAPRDRLDLTTLPMPAHELLGVDYLPSCRIHFARGCSNHCRFCADVIWCQRITFYSIDKVLDEIQWLYHNLGTRFFYVGDETFASNKKHALEVCRRIAQLNLPDMYWGCQSRVDTISKELLDAFVESHCLTIDMGMETTSNQILADAGKNLSYDTALNHLEILKPYASKIPGRTTYWMFGLPGETEETAIHTRNEIARLIRENYICAAEYKRLVPYPGTRIWQELMENNGRTEELQIEEDFTIWEKYVQQAGGSLCRPPYIPEKRMQELYFDSIVKIGEAMTDHCKNIYGNLGAENISDMDSAVVEGIF